MARGSKPRGVAMAYEPRLTSRMSRPAGPEMPEQDPHVRLLNLEYEREKHEKQTAMLRAMMYGAIGVTAITLVALALRDDKKDARPEKT